MKKLIFSIVIAVFYISYIVYERGLTPEQNIVIAPPAQNLLNSQLTDNSSSTGAADPPAATTGTQTQTPRGSSTSGQTTVPAPQPTPTPTSAPQPTPAPAPAPAPTPAPKPQGQYKDGQYTGSSVDAYYGFVQVSATVSGGKITDVQFLSYPSDRSTSRQINSQAMPYLKQEAIAAQSASVNIISGATDTSQAFIQSLATALSQAKI